VVSRDALNFGVIQTFVAVLLVVGLVGLGAVWSARKERARP
jgi:Flp pilus assembly pilin Flp